MRAAALIFVLLIAAPVALAAGGEAVEMRDGPGKDARKLEPFWIMRCSNDARLVGLRVHADRSIAGVEALCATFSADGPGIQWLSKPRLWVAPAIAPPPKPVVKIVAPRSEGTILRAESGTVMRYRGSRAEVISVPRVVAPPPEEPAEPRRYLLSFAETRDTQDLVCPTGQFVQGLRTGAGERGLDALQLICGDGGAGTAHVVGAWPRPQKGRRLSVQRVQCAGASSNPLDGKAADAVFGTIEDRRILSLGLTCAAEIAPAG